MNIVSIINNKIAGSPTFITSFNAVFIPTAAIAESRAHLEISAAVVEKIVGTNPKEFTITKKMKATTKLGKIGRC